MKKKAERIRIIIKGFHEEQTMKKSVLLCSFILIFNSLIFAQEIIENPEKPLSKNAGRMVLLEEEMRIRDDGEKIIFRAPRHLSLSKDGSVFFMDGPYFFKYDKDGQLIFKVGKQGQGPGECQFVVNYFFMGNRIRAQASRPPKVMDYDCNGRYIKEIKIDIPYIFWLLTCSDDKIHGIRDELHFDYELRKSEGFIESPFTLYEVSEDFKKMRKIYDIPVKRYIKRGRWWRRAILDVAAYDHFLFIVHTAEYKIVKFNIRSARVERIFKRKYKRKKTLKKETEEIGKPRPLAPPPLEYDFDIIRIHIFKDTLWVITSTTKDSGTKRHVDVFNMEGKYIDSFYLQFPLNNARHWIGTTILSDDGYILIVEQNQDGFISIGKYRIKDKF